MTEIKRRLIDQLLDSTFLQDLEGMAYDVLQTRRAMCDDLDLEYSYYRRMLHGRMDLLAFELRHRAGEEEQTLLEALPRILAGGADSATPGLPSRTLSVDAPDIPTLGRRLIDRALNSDFLARLGDFTDEELLETQRFLMEIESEVSIRRRGIHAAHDRLEAELTRRYREGLADPGESLARA
ncbi:MAG TPA: hypothetical protein DCY40_00435 [Actinobacteria bacterium]|nr:hypothetical protein [Actinomycetota bacterium]